MLEQILESKSLEIRNLRLDRKRQIRCFKSRENEKTSFIQALKSPSDRKVIAEYKPGSPSLGPINSTMAPEDMASVFQIGQAAAVSVLTDSLYFHSSLDNLDAFSKKDLPIMRKDFIIDKLQIDQTAGTQASALLLITRLFDKAQDHLPELVSYSLRLGLEPVVEIFDLKDLQLARRTKARCLLVNNRDLKSLAVDLSVSQKLIAYKAPEEIWICASGLSSPQEVQDMHELGYNACLIGTSIMKSQDPLETLKSFVSG